MESILEMCTVFSSAHNSLTKKKSEKLRDEGEEL